MSRVATQIQNVSRETFSHQHNGRPGRHASTPSWNSVALSVIFTNHHFSKDEYNLLRLVIVLILYYSFASLLSRQV